MGDQEFWIFLYLLLEQSGDVLAQVLRNETFLLVMQESIDKVIQRKCVLIWVWSWIRGRLSSLGFSFGLKLLDLITIKALSEHFITFAPQDAQ